MTSQRIEELKQENVLLRQLLTAVQAAATVPEPADDADWGKVRDLQASRITEIDMWLRGVPHFSHVTLRRKIAMFTEDVTPASYEVEDYSVTDL